MITELLLEPELATESENRNFCERFLSGKYKRYVLGTNQWGRSIANAVKIDGFIDDYLSLPEVNGLPVLRTENVPRDALAISANVLGRPLTARKRLNNHKIENLDYFSFRKISGLCIDSVLYMDSCLLEYYQNEKKYKWLFSILADQESKRQMQKVMNFRIHQNLFYMDGFLNLEDKQYFEDFLQLQIRNESFVDAGGFDGSTSEQFVKHCPEYSEIHLIEPDPVNMEKARLRLASVQRIFFHQCGLSRESVRLPFASAGPSSRIDDSSQDFLPFLPLDTFISNHPITFIKMDIEGHEKDALTGARNLLSCRNVTLAIAAYHKVDDLWRLAEHVLSICPDYRVYIRHYTEGITETILFFVPAIEKKRALS